jgi:hypothetical protein
VKIGHLDDAEAAEGFGQILQLNPDTVDVEPMALDLSGIDGEASGGEDTAFEEASARPDLGRLIGHSAFIFCPEIDVNGAISVRFCHAGASYVPFSMWLDCSPAHLDRTFSKLIWNVLFFCILT